MVCGRQYLPRRQVILLEIDATEPVDLHIEKRRRDPGLLARRFRRSHHLGNGALLPSDSDGIASGIMPRGDFPAAHQSGLSILAAARTAKQKTAPGVGSSARSVMF